MGLIKSYVKNTNIHKEKLNEEYRGIFDDIMVYFRTSQLPDKEIEVALQDILSNFLESQASGKTVSEIIGDNYKGFCENIILELKASPKVKKRILLNHISLLFLISVVLIVIDYIFEVVDNFIKNKTILLNYSVSIDNILQIILGIIVMIILLKMVRNSDESNKSYNKYKEFIKMFCFLFLIFLLIPLASKFFKLGSMVILTTKIYFIIPTLYLGMMGFSYLANE